MDFGPAKKKTKKKNYEKEKIDTIITLQSQCW